MKLFLPVAGILALLATPAIAELNRNSAVSLDSAGQITSVNQLSDIQPTDRVFQAVQSLIERYDCITVNADHPFQSNRPITRHEFAADLNACFNYLSEQSTMLVRAKDIETLSHLQQEFTAELETLREQIDALEARTETLESQQFSTTTQLRGQAIFAINAGDFTGGRIVDAQGRVIENEQLNPTLVSRAALDISTSFTGTDSLRILLEMGAGGRTTNVAGQLEPSFGSVLDFTVKPPTRDTVGIGRLVYSFNPTPNLQVAIGPEVRIGDYIDRNRYANSSFRDFSSQIFVNNLLLMTNDGPSSGGSFSWSPGSGAVSLRGMYSARDAANPSSEGPIRGGAPFLPLLYPVPGGNRGVFGDTYQYTAELEYAPSSAFVLRIQYAAGAVFSNRFNVFGVNSELQLSPQIALFGRYGYGSYDNTTFGNISPNYWMFGAAFPDLLEQGVLAGIAIGQPFVANEIGQATQTNFEAFYRFGIGDNISVTPLIQVVTNPSNQIENGTIITGTVRTVFSF